jgi:hypothetical protein
MYPVMAYMLRCLGSGAWKRQQTSTKWNLMKKYNT